MNETHRREAEEYVLAAGPRLLALARSLTRSTAEAEDLLQDSLVKVYTRWSRVRGAESIDAYVRRIMVNTLISGRRKASYRNERVTEQISAVADHRGSAPDGAVATTDGAYVLQVLGTLPPLQRAVLTLRFLEDMADDEIARDLDVSRSSVASAASRGLAALRGTMTREQVLAGDLGGRRRPRRSGATASAQA